MTHNEILDFAISYIGRGDDYLERLKAYKAPQELITVAQINRNRENEVKQYLKALKK